MRQRDECGAVKRRTMSLLCDLCGDSTVLEHSLVVLEAQVILFVEAHSAQDGHQVRMTVA